MVETNKKEELKGLLERLNSNELTEELKEEARQLIKEIDAKELSEAEQALIEDGLPETELRHLCTAHIEAMAEELDSLKADVSENHPLHTLITEHDQILAILDNLEDANREIQQLKAYQPDEPVFERLKMIGRDLLETASHHEREEDALFPELDKMGITGPTRIMRMEHEDLWPRKVRVDYLARHADELDFELLKKELKENAEYILLVMRDHIYKENHILYPTANDMIAEEKWENIKMKSDKIGYSSFISIRKEK